MNSSNKASCELIVIYQTNVQSTYLAFRSTEHYNYEAEGKLSAILIDDQHVIAYAINGVVLL